MSIVIIGASANIAKTAQRIGLPLIFVQKPGSGVDGLMRPGDSAYSVDYENLVQVAVFAEEVLAPLKPKAVVSVSETGLLPAAVVSEQLGLPGTPTAVVERLRNKVTMRERLRQAAPQLNPWFADLDEFEGNPFESGERSLIIKPRYGTASTGVQLVRTRAEFVSARRNQGLIAEEYLEGTEYSVEGFSREGAHHIVAITQKVTGPGFVEVGHVTPPIDLTPRQEQLVRSAVVEFLDAVGLTDGPSHTELKLDGEQPKIIESHNRPGGDRISDLVAMTTNFDFRQWSLAWPAGRWPQPAEAAHCAAAVTFIVASPGLVIETSVPPQRPDVREVRLFVSPGDTVNVLRSSADRVGNVIVTGADAAECLTAAQAVAGEVRVVTRTAEEAG